MKDIGLLVLRVVCGGLLAGHGSQKLLGWFGGHGHRGTAAWLESIGLRPGARWALAAGSTELAGGVLTALGALWPLGPITMMGPMAMAIRTVHWKRPVWVTEGGAELPLTNLAIAAALATTGPGRLSIDRALGIRVPAVLTAAAAVATVAGLAVGVSLHASQRPATPVEPAANGDRQVAQSASRQSSAT
jgi:putative oxidoreductase